MSKAIKELERKKREEERKRLMQRVYETPTPPYAPPLIPPMKKGSSNPIKMVGGIPIATGKEEVIVMLHSAIEDELSASREYVTLANKLHNLGYTKEEYEVSNIQLDELTHRKTLNDILERLQRK